MISLGYYRILLLTVIFTCILLSTIFLNSTPYKADNLILSSTEDVNSQGYPGSFVQLVHPEASNTSYCNFNYGFPYDLKYEVADIAFGPEQGKKSQYRILYNVVEAKLDGSLPRITYATHVTGDFVNYILELVRYWDGLISVAAFVPDTDVALVLEQINQYCYCLPGMSRVSIHLVYPKKLPPSRKDIYFPKPTECKIVDSSKLSTYRSFDEQVVYPINVCRNAARTAALTENVLVSDIQLIPSENLARNFCKMMEIYNYAECPNKVYVVPIFEVEVTENIPRTKKQLVQLVREGKAIYFHKLVCSHCQRFPGIESWMLTNPGNVIKPMLVTRREVPYNRWEPIFIGTKDEPLYNENMSWEGLQDKMLQVLEMCLIGYKFVVLDGAFLVHWPGMKKTKTQDGETWRYEFIKQNEEEYDRIVKNLSMRYTLNPQCKLN